MEKIQIIEACSKALPKFKQVLENETYQLRGILNSEALLIIAVAEHFGVNHIIESGRARGHSTNLLAKYFSSESDLRITSIDLDKHSNDAKYSEDYLKKYTNLDLIYGDSFDKVPESIKEDCIVFMDGPKGEDALELCSNLLKDSRVKAVLMHDLHKNVFPRDIAELIYTSYFFTDDKQFVERFKDLDEGCWKIMEGTGYEPYVRAGTKVLSYGHTLGVIFNVDTPFNQPAHNNYQVKKISDRLNLKSILIKSFFKFYNKFKLHF